MAINFRSPSSYGAVVVGVVVAVVVKAVMVKYQFSFILARANERTITTVNFSRPS